MQVCGQISFIRNQPLTTRRFQKIQKTEVTLFQKIDSTTGNSFAPVSSGVAYAEPKTAEEERRNEQEQEDSRPASQRNPCRARFTSERYRQRNPRDIQTRNGAGAAGHEEAPLKQLPAISIHRP